MKFLLHKDIGNQAPRETLLLVRDELTDGFIFFVVHGNSQCFSVSRDRKAINRDYYPIAFISLLNRALVDPLYRDHSAAEIAIEGSLGSAQLRRVTLS